MLLPLVESQLQLRPINSVGEPTKETLLTLTEAFLNESNSAPLANNMHQIILTQLEVNWLYLIFAFVGGLGLLLCFRPTIQKYCKKFLRTLVKTHLCLRVFASGGSITLRLQTFYTPSSNIIVQMTDEPRDLTIIGVINPRLSFTWEATVLEEAVQTSTASVQNTWKLT